MKALFGFTLLVLLSGCSHTINFRASHFAIPVTGEDQWSGHVALVGASVTKVTVINDITSNPPNRSSLLINESVDAGDLMFFNNLGLDASLTVFKSIDLYMDNGLFGLRYQFLNHGAAAQNWVASLQGAYGKKEVSTSEGSSGSTDAEAKSKVTTSQAGISLGYKLEKIVPYISYIYESHDVSTDVTNTHGNFNYKDKGIHQYYSIGIASHGKGLDYGIEYTRVNIDWNRSNTQGQDAMAVKLGIAW